MLTENAAQEVRPDPSERSNRFQLLLLKQRRSPAKRERLTASLALLEEGGGGGVGGFYIELRGVIQCKTVTASSHGCRAAPEEPALPRKEAPSGGLGAVEED